jgi:hypothetical protein
VTINILVVGWNEGIPGERHIVVEAGDRKNKIKNKNNSWRGKMAQEEGVGKGRYLGFR